MLVLEKKKHGTVFRTIWYAEKALKKPGINRYRYAKFHTDMPYQEADTLVSNLEEDEAELISHFTKNCRYEIRRAPKEGVACECRVGKQLTEEDIQKFGQFFEEFWKSKGIKARSKEQYIKEIREYAAQDAFAISTAKLGDKILVYHTYIVGDDFVRLYQSASQFREDESVPYQLIGMANRFLHKEDMLFFQEQGKKVYDWGGAGKGEDVASITRFKEAFGGAPLKVYEWEEVIGFKAKAVKGLIKLLEKF